MMKLERAFRKNQPDIVLSDGESEEESKTEAESSEKVPNIITQSSLFKYRPKFQSQEEEFNCEECDYQGTSKNGLQKHFQIKHVHKEIIRCKICSEMFTTNQNLRTHIKTSHTEENINCHKCDSDVTSKQNVQKHSELKHERSYQFDCRICGEEFQTKGNLMYHRKNVHTASVAPCRNTMNGQPCRFSDDKCWWRHVEITGDNKTCYICGKTFTNRNEMMMHRKIDHGNVVKECQDFHKKQCRFQNNFCWFKHTMKENVNQIESELNQVFQKASENLKPPIREDQQRRD